jgi:hypothetical protein
MTTETNHPFVEFFVLLAEHVIAFHKGENFERGNRPPLWLRRVRLLTFPIWWLVTGIFALLAIVLMIAVLVAFELVPNLVNKFKEAWRDA